MANITYLKKGDTYPPLYTTLSDELGPVNLTGATILFRMSQPQTGNLMIERAATAMNQSISDNIGRVYFTWVSGDTDVIGLYRVEWRVTFASGKVATFPRGGTVENFNYVDIKESVD